MVRVIVSVLCADSATGYERGTSIYSLHTPAIS